VEENGTGRRPNESTKRSQMGETRNVHGACFVKKKPTELTKALENEDLNVPISKKCMQSLLCLKLIISTQVSQSFSSFLFFLML
jgi:hypothetical protein